MRVFALLAVVLASGAASAQIVDERVDPLKNAYFAFNVGKADYAWRNPPPGLSKDLCSIAGLLDCRDDPVGWKLTAGYMIWRHVGLELAAYSMGDARIKFDAGGGTIVEQTIRVEGYALSAVGAVPLGPVTLAARAGYAASTATRNDDVASLGVSTRSAKSRAEPIFGAGVDFKVWRGLTVRLDWDRARARTPLGEKFEADLYSAGIGWRF